MSTVTIIIGSSTDWRTRWNTAALIFLVLVAALFALPASSHETGDDGVGGTGITVQLSSEIERARKYFTDTVLTTHEGNEVRFFSDLLEGRVVMINVMYTSCKGACPLVTQMMSQVSRDLGDLYGREIHFVSMTNDPERDSPEALAEFARKQNVNLDGWTFLTGSKQKIDGVIKKIGLYTPNFEQHKAMILIGNTRTGHWQKIRPNIPYQAIATKLKELVDEV